jgi:hypothetical protein
MHPVSTHSSRLKEKILKELPDLEAHNIDYFGLVR